MTILSYLPWLADGGWDTTVGTDDVTDGWVFGLTTLGGCACCGWIVTICEFGGRCWCELTGGYKDNACTCELKYIRIQGI